MATRVFCDRCDTNVTDDRYHAKVEMRRPRYGLASLNDDFIKEIDLCALCYSRLRSFVNEKADRAAAA